MQKLLTQAIKKALPPLYATEKQAPQEKKVVAKFFSIRSQHRFYAIEFDGQDTFFGLTITNNPSDAELGYFSLSELSSLNVRGMPVIERDMWWDSKTTLADVQAGKVY